MLASMHLLRGFLEDPSWVAVPWKWFSGFASSCWRGATIRDRQRGDYFYGLRASLEARSHRLKLAWDRRTLVYTEKSTECMVHRKKHMYPVPWCMLVPNEFVPCHDPPIDRCVFFEYLANAIWRKGSGEGLKGSNVFWAILCKYSVCWYNNMFVYWQKQENNISWLFVLVLSCSQFLASGTVWMDGLWVYRQENYIFAHRYLFFLWDLLYMFRIRLHHFIVPFNLIQPLDLAANAPGRQGWNQRLYISNREHACSHPSNVMQYTCTYTGPKCSHLNWPHV